ncbi:hypothetical protein AC579_1762 [Pseudocercospora musae]|uniref:Cytochrome P450 n=1 Tax=Pseudocercospora musae TaxID=113226 RepID=A0A139IPJ3_9PEZI|nr:hypothetical protein AC579_1762 [Pseudocercospora musae]
MIEIGFFQLSAALAAVFLIHQLALAYYNARLSPLHRIPGPWYASITSIPKKYATAFQKREAHYTYSLVKRYGPFVRTGPNEVVITDPEAFKRIHRIGTRFLKTDLYKYLNPTPPGQAPYGLFQMSDPAAHAARRKLLSRGFTLNSLRTHWEGTVQERIDFAMTSMKKEARTGSEVDIFKWLPLMAGDIAAMLMFGESFNMLERAQPDPMVARSGVNAAGNALAYNFPILYHILRLIPLPAIQNLFQGNPVLLERGKLAVQNSKGASEAKNIFSRVLDEAEKDDPVLTDQETIVEAGSFLFAGTDTTATTLTFLIWSVLSNPALQKDLETEVASLGEPFTEEQVEDLPILNAVIKETLRLYGAAPAALPRVTPPEGVTFGNYFLPGGTTVATPAWTLHRDPKIFPDPEKFDHSRWLGDLASRDEVKAIWCPFGAGSRVCIGIHLAYMEFRLTTASFFRQCSGARLAASTTPESMEVENIFLIAPKSRRCNVVIPTEA